MSTFPEIDPGAVEVTAERETSGEACLDVLRRRRSMKRWRPDPVPRQLIETLLEAGVWAPNHHKTEPWRFVVLTGDARRALGDVMAATIRPPFGNQDDDLAASLKAKARTKPLQAPALIAVAAIPGSGPKVREIEEIEATAAAVQNMLIAAEALGLGAMWRTGDFAYEEEVKRFLGLPLEAQIVAFIYLGFPDLPDLPERDRSAAPYTTWLSSSVTKDPSDLETE